MFPAFSQDETPPPPSVEQIPLTLYKVERTKFLSIPTQGTPRVLVINPIAIEVESVSDTQVSFRALRIDSSLVHIWDQSGRRTIRIVVTELASVLRQQREREQEALRRKIGLPDRSLKLQYRGTHRNLERGENQSLSGTHEQYRIRTHQWKARMGTSAGLLVGDAFLEERRDTTLGKEVTQPRHLSLALQEHPMGPLGKMDLVAGDNDLYLSDFTLPGGRYRGLSLLPHTEGTFGRKKPREEPGLTLFAGEERQGYGLDLEAGRQTRQARSKLAGIQVEYPLLQGLQVHTTGLHREGKNGEFKADHVYEVGLNWDWKELSKFDLDAARNGPEGATQADWEIFPTDDVKVRNRLWRIGKNYRTVTGGVARNGQTGWRNTVDWRLPFYDKAITLSSGVTFYRDQNDLNPVNPGEWNTLYSLNSNVRLSRDTTLRAGVSRDDRRATSFPQVTQRVEGELSREITVALPLLAGVTPFFGAQYSDIGKSSDIPGADAALYLYRTGLRANFWKGIWASTRFSQGVLKEHEPESPPSRILPEEFLFEFGDTHAFTSIPAFFDATFRVVDVQETFSKTHQPFSDQNSLSGNLRFTWKFGPGREWFTSFQASRQIPETSRTGLNPLVEIFLESGIRLDWDTKWAPGQQGAITGSVFQDLNANTRRDPEEPGIPGVRVYIEGEKTSTRTNATGAYSLRAREGPTVVKIDWAQIPPGHFFTTGNTVEEFVLPRKKVTVNFGVSTETEFRGIVFNDIDEDLAYTAAVDEPVQGVRLSMETGQSSASGPTGHYSIRKVRPGAHTVSVDISSIPDGYQTLVPIRKTAETKEGDVVPFDVPLKAQRTISGSVFLDADGNTLRDDSETGVEGVRLEVDSQSSVTDSSGAYRLTGIPPGRRRVRVVPESIPSGHFLRSPEAVEIDAPKGPLDRERLNFSLSAKPGLPFEPPRPPTSTPVPEAEKPPAEEDRVRAQLSEIIGPDFIPQVVDGSLAERFPEIAALARAHRGILIDRSETYEQALGLVMQLAYQSAYRVFYYEYTFRSGWFRRAAQEAMIEMISVQPKEDSVSLLLQILSNGSGVSETSLAERVDVDALVSRLRGKENAL